MSLTRREFLASAAALAVAGWFKPGQVTAPLPHIARAAREVIEAA